MHPIITIFSLGNNGSSTLFGGIHTDHQELPAIALQPSEEQRFNKFHLHSFESLAAVLESFPDRPHKIIYPVRRDVERQVISAFIRYAGRIEKRPDRLGLPPGKWRNWPAQDVMSAFSRFVELQRIPYSYAEFHRKFLEMFDIQPEPLTRAQSFSCAQADVLIVPSEAIIESESALASFVRPAKVAPLDAHQTSNERAALVRLLRPRARALLAVGLKDLQAEFPAFYSPRSRPEKVSLWMQVCSWLHLPFGDALRQMDA